MFDENVEPTKEFAQRMDKYDPFHKFRSEFYFPLNCQAYLTGFGLGLESKNSVKYVNKGLDEWKKYGSDMYAESETPLQICEKNCETLMVDIVGAKNTDEVCIMNGCSVNANLLLVSFYKHQLENEGTGNMNGKKNKILIEQGAFCSDYHIIEGICDLNNLNYNDTLIEIKPATDSNGYIISDNDIINTIIKYNKEIALIWLGLPNYLTGQVFDIKNIAETAHKYNIVVGLDLSHGVGNIALKLHEWEVDFASWCSYKYLNGSGGAVGGIFVHEKHHSNNSNNRNNKFVKLRGWWGQTRDYRYKFDKKHIPINNAQSWSIGQAPLLLSLCLEGSLEYFVNAGGISNLRYKSESLIKYIDSLFINNSYLKTYVKIITPKDLNKRGNGFMLMMNDFNNQSDADLLGEYLKQNGIMVFVKKPNIVRFSIHPLYSTFGECYYFATVLAKFFQNKIKKNSNASGITKLRSSL